MCSGKDGNGGGDDDNNDPLLPKLLRCMPTAGHFSNTLT